MTLGVLSVIISTASFVTTLVVLDEVRDKNNRLHRELQEQRHELAICYDEIAERDLDIMRLMEENSIGDFDELEEK